MLIRKLFVAIICVVLLNACAATKPGPVPEYTGFLPDYSLLKPGKKGQAERIYVNQNVDWDSYDKVLLDPVTLWRGKASQLNGVSQADAQKLADYFYQLIYASLSKDYQMVRTPQPNTLRIGVAIVKLEEDRVVLETVSTIVPQLRLATKLANVVTGDAPLVGKASVEAKITDASTGQLLAEGVDERVGGKSLSGLSLSSWGDVDHIMQYWVKRATYNLCMKRGGNDCVAP